MRFPGPAIIALFSLSLPGNGQTYVSGTVLDGSGAVVSGAQLDLRHVSTGLARAATSQADGAFHFAFLPIGVYRAECRKAGFQTAVREAVVLQLAQSLRLDFVLTLGPEKQDITVTAGPALVNTENAELGEVIENRRMAGLPLNGRQFLQLAELTPGISRGPSGGFRGNVTANLTGPNITVNGARDTENYYTVDGVTANDRLFNSLTFSPSVEAIQEFRVQSGLYSAASGVTAGSQISVAIKSGSNEVHGTLYEYFRNDRLNARHFFDPARKPAYRQNQYGASVGGPLARNRTFYFANWEELRGRVPQSRPSTVPTERMREGDFTEFGIRLRDPLAAAAPGAGALFPDNRIPASLWDPVAKEVTAMLPAPNRAGLSQNLLASPAASNDSGQGSLRLDHRFSDRDTLFGRLTVADVEAFSPYGGGVTIATRETAAMPGFGWTRTSNARQLALVHTRIWSARAVSEIRFGYSRISGGQVHQNAGHDVARRHRIAGVTGLGPSDSGIPRFSVTGISAFGDEPVTIVRSNADFQYQAGFSYSPGRHALRAGFEHQRVRFAPSIQSLVRGLFSFGAAGNSTGLGFGDFLLGIPHQGNAAGLAEADFRGHEYYGYVQDTWRLRPALSLNFGLRYEFQQPLADRDLRVGNLDLDSRTIIVPSRGGRAAPETAFLSGTLSGGFTAGDARFPMVTSEQFGLPAGLIHSDRNNLAPRFGLAWGLLPEDRLVLRAGYGIYYGRKEQFATSTLAARPPFGFSVSRTNLAPVPPVNPGGARLSIANFLAPAGLSAGLQPVGPRLRSGYSQQWSLDLQHTAGKDWLLATAYAGSKGTKLFLIDSRNYRRPGAGDESRELAPYATGVPLWSDFGFSTYHSWQTRLVRRLAGGLQFSASYTVAKSLDNNSAGASGSNDSDSGGIHDPRNRRLEKARSAFDARHRFVASGVYEQWGWQLGFIASWRSGTAFTVDSTRDFAGIARANSNRPDLTGDPNSGPRSAEQWFRLAAFANPAPGRFGTAGRNILEADGFSGVDVSLARTTRLTERWKLETRGEVFNLTNHTNFGTPNRTYVPRDGAAGASNNINPDYGRVFSAADPRVAQVAMRLVF